METGSRDPGVGCLLEGKLVLVVVEAITHESFRRAHTPVSKRPHRRIIEASRGDNVGNRKRNVVEHEA